MKLSYFLTGVLYLLFGFYSANAKDIEAKSSNKDGNPEQAQQQNIPPSLRGAELYADVQGGRVVLHLKKFYDCISENISETETVSMQETELMVSEQVVLKKESVNKLENSGLQTPGDNHSGCLIVAIYSKEMDLGTRHANYDFTWGYQFMPRLTNIEMGKNQNISLSLHVSNNGSGEMNAMPSLATLPAFVIHPTINAATTISAKDNDNDKVSIEISAPHSIINAIPNPINISAQNNMGGIMEGSVVIGKGPFEKVKYKKGYSENNPLNAKVFTIDKNTGEFRYQPSQVAGKYLVAITLKDTRDKKILSEHQCVFIIDVQ